MRRQRGAGVFAGFLMTCVVLAVFGAVGGLLGLLWLTLSALPYLGLFLALMVLGFLAGIPEDP